MNRGKIKKNVIEYGTRGAIAIGSILLNTAINKGISKLLKGEKVVKDFLCPTCGYQWKAVSDRDGLFKGYGLPPCPKCGDTCIESHRIDLLRGRSCEYCGESLRGGESILPWENGRNPDGYTICPHCGRANFRQSL